MFTTKVTQGDQGGGYRDGAGRKSGWTRLGAEMRGLRDLKYLTQGLHPLHRRGQWGPLSSCPVLRQDCSDWGRRVVGPRSLIPGIHPLDEEGNFFTGIKDLFEVQVLRLRLWFVGQGRRGMWTQEIQSQRQTHTHTGRSREVGGGTWGQAGSSSVVPSCLPNKIRGPSPNPMQRQSNSGQMITCVCS